MKRRKPIQTSVREAVAYWRQRVDENELSIDWSEAETHCWRCGCKRNLQRCHIVPDPLGGEDTPSNIVLLYSSCHKEGPNVTDPEIMWDWIKAYAVPAYQTFWMALALREYRFLYRCTVTQNIAEICAASGIDFSDTAVLEFKREIDLAVLGKASTHFGQPYFNTATLAGLYRMAVKELAEKYRVDLADARSGTENPEGPWWLADLRC